MPAFDLDVKQPKNIHYVRNNTVVYMYKYMICLNYILFTGHKIFVLS